MTSLITPTNGDVAVIIGNRRCDHEFVIIAPVKPYIFIHLLDLCSGREILLGLGLGFTAAIVNFLAYCGGIYRHNSTVHYGTCMLYANGEIGQFKETISLVHGSNRW